MAILTVHANNEQKQQTHSVHMGFYSSFINKKTNFIPLKIPLDFKPVQYTCS